MLILLMALCLKTDVEANKVAYIIPNKLENCQVVINLDEFTPVVDMRYNVNWVGVKFIFIYSKPHSFSLHKLLETLSKNKNNKINMCQFKFQNNGR